MAPLFEAFIARPLALALARWRKCFDFQVLVGQARAGRGPRAVIRVSIVHQRGAQSVEISHGMREGMNDLHSLTDSELLSTLDASLASERELTARVVRVLMEVEERRRHLGRPFVHVRLLY